jgi:hypothetical protein
VSTGSASGTRRAAQGLCVGASVWTLRATRTTAVAAILPVKTRRSVWGLPASRGAARDWKPAVTPAWTRRAAMSTVVVVETPVHPKRAATTVPASAQGRCKTAALAVSTWSTTTRTVASVTLPVARRSPVRGRAVCAQGLWLPVARTAWIRWKIPTTAVAVGSPARTSVKRETASKSAAMGSRPVG